MWWGRAAPSKQAYLLAALVGLVVHLLVFGVGHALGTSSYWDLPQEDSRAYLMGYRYFLHEPWHWPPFIVHDMNVPYTKSIAYTDSIPLWAAINKAIATVVPPWGRFSERAYLGLWHALVYVLQACFGVANLRAVGKKSYGNALVTALFFLAIPAFVLRYGHASLSAQFLLLWALLLYFRTPEGRPRSLALQLGFAVQLAVAALINPYHVATSFALYVASLLKTRHLRTVLVGVPVGLASVGLAAALAGFFAKEAKTPMGGFDSASANILSPFIARRSVLFGDMRWLANVEATQYQHEGYDYLGLGFLVLLVLFLPRAKSALATIRRHPFLFAVAFGLWVFSLSTHIYFGSHRLIAIEFPEKLRWVTEQYRAPGRFIWLPTYVLLIFLLRWGMDRFTRGWQVLVLPALAALQIVDGGLGDWRYVADYTSKPFQHYVDFDRWRTLIHAHSAIEIQPPYDCILDGTPHMDHVSQELQFLASEKTLRINGVYTARPTRDCIDEARLRGELIPKPDTLYVLLPRVAGITPRLEARGAVCGEFEHGRACSKTAAAIERARREGLLRTVTPPPVLAPGQKVLLGVGGDPSFLATGWSWPEGGFRWSAENVAGIHFRVPESAERSSVTLKLGVMANLCGERTSADVDVWLNGTTLTTLHFDEGSNGVDVPRSIPITDPTALDHDGLLLELHVRDTRSPRTIGCAPDDRQLGIAVRDVWYE